MGCYRKVVLFPDPALNAVDFIICKLNDSAAVDTTKVAVMLVTIDVLVVKVAVLEIDLLNQSAIYKEGDGPVEGGLGDSLLFVPQPQKELIHVEVIMDREDLINDCLPFRSVAKPFFLDIFAKFLYGFHDLTIIIENHYQ
jgi:hypothetical protein